MKRVLIFILFIPTFLAAQTLQVEKTFNSSIYFLNELEIDLSGESIRITEDSQNIYTENISGKKIFKSSSAENYFLIANFQFSTNKVDYSVEVRVFDKKGEMIFPFKFIAAYDLPHPLLTINDNGVLGFFDPLAFKIKLLSDDSYQEFQLEKEVSFEMEKAAFMEMTEDFLFVLTSHAALDITENASNVMLYRINIVDSKVDKRIFDYNTPTYFGIIEGYVYISGVKFENLQPIGRTFKLNLNMETQSSNDKIIEKIFSWGNLLYAKYFNKIYQLDKDLAIINQFQFAAGERIIDIFCSDKKLFASTSLSGKNFLHLLSHDLNVDFTNSLDIFEINNLSDVNTNKNTLVIHHDSKTTVLQITGN